MKTIIKKFDYEIYDLGCNYPDFFQGFCPEEFDGAVYGIGDTFNAALLDAVEQLASYLFSDSYDSYCVDYACNKVESEVLPPERNEKTHIENYVDNQRGWLPDEVPDLPYYFVGIRFNIVGDDAVKVG